VKEENEYRLKQIKAEQSEILLELSQIRKERKDLEFEWDELEEERVAIWEEE
tara:strand:- start:43 stop:198 length:156 start_codon:yes stop_codon:yes gene_type:complete